ncbi:hypothetical protein DDI_3444 [Dickeya dianthicola RNS04.9]|nr:hypothetical protein DDI_3444 [Dickeya dianthicola RNS04.9]
MFIYLITDDLINGFFLPTPRGNYSDDTDISDTSRCYQYPLNNEPPDRHSPFSCTPGLI